MAAPVLDWTPPTTYPSALLPPTGRLVPPTGQAVSTPRSVDYSNPGAVLSLLGTQGTNVLGRGEQALTGGQEALRPVLAYLMKLMGGDPAAINEAILPEVQGVLSQYDTARRAISEFTPRGGGQTSALSNLRIGAASDIAGLRSTARRSAVGELARLGLGQEQIGTNLSSLGLQGLDAAMRGALYEAQSKRQMWANLGMGIGSIAASAFAPMLMGKLLGSQAATLPASQFYNPAGTTWYMGGANI